MLRPLRSRLRALWHRNRRRAELDEELAFHLETEAGERQDAGASTAEARRAARLEFGNPAVVAEDTRATWGWTLLEQLAQDVRYALRTLGRTRAFTAAALLCLTLGIGANTLLYSLTDAILLRTLPVSDPPSLVRMTWRTPKSENHGSAYHDSSFVDPTGYTNGVFSHTAFELFVPHDDVLVSVFAYQSTGAISLSIHDQTTPATGEYVSGGYFSGLGVLPAAGRLLVADDDRDGAPPAVVIASALAVARFGGPDAAVGQSLLLNNRPFTIVGVTPDAFYGTDPGLSPDLFVPLHSTALVEASVPLDEVRARFTDPGEGWVEIMGRLAPGVTLERAQATLAPPFQQFTQRVKDTGHHWEQAPTLALVPGAQGLDGLRRDYATPLLLLMGLAGLILLLACANIANLLLARSAARTREIAVRLSLGAARARVIRQLLTETAVLSVAGGLLGIGVAVIGNPVISALLTEGQPGLVLHADLNWRVLLFACGLSVVTGLVFGLIPALRSTRMVLLAAIADARATAAPASTRRAGPARSMIVLQMGATLVLLVAAGLFARTLANFSAIDLGFNPRHVLTVMVDAKQAGFDDAGAAAVYLDLRDRLQAIAGVESVGFSENALIGDGRSATTVRPTGRELKKSSAILNIGPGFFATMGISLVNGRAIDDRDVRAGAKPVVVVSEAWARGFFGDENALGQFVKMPRDSARVAALDFEIVGIARDVRYGRLLLEHQPIVYVPFSIAIFDSVRRMVYEIRTATDASSYERTIRQIVHDTSSRIPITRVATQDGLIDSVIATPILLTRLCVTFALLALAIAVVGLYGSVAYDVSRRVREIGVRMALGADAGQIVRMILGHVSVLALAGVALGIPAALGASKYAAAYLYGVTSHDPLTVAASAGVLVAAALLASYVPARAASRLPPTTALRLD